MVWLKRDRLTPAPQRTAAGDRREAAPEAARSTGPDALVRLRALIENGKFAEGSKLPSERALAAELATGRPAIREAIKILCGLGVLESKRGSGTYLKSGGTAAEFAPADFGVFDLLEVRKMLEPRAAWLAATRADPRQMLEIESARSRLELRDRDWKVVARLDYDLHASIFRGANNPVLLVIYEFLMSRILGNSGERFRFPSDLQAMRDGHKAIVEAILRRQPDAAEKAMIDHLQSTGVNLIKEGSR